MSGSGGIGGITPMGGIGGMGGINGIGGIAGIGGMGGTCCANPGVAPAIAITNVTMCLKLISVFL
jgi:hypothetical protein